MIARSHRLALITLIAATVATAGPWITVVHALDPAHDLAACFERPVADARVVGCDASCEPPLLSLLASVARGVRLTPSRADQLVQRIEASRLTTKARLTCIAAGPASLLELDVVPMTYVRRVEITGNEAFRRKDILKRVFLRPGTPLPVDPKAPLEDEQVRRQVESIERLYRQSGLDEVKVEVLVTPVDRTHIDLEVRLREGARTRLESVVARHLHSGQPDPDATSRPDLRCPTIDQRRLERLVGLGVGDVWTRVLERQLKERLRLAFQGAGFERPKVSVVLSDNPPGELHVTVETERCWLVRIWERDLPATASDSALSFRWQDPVHPDDARADPPGDAATRALTSAPPPWRRAEPSDFTKTLPFAESGSFERDEASRGVASLAAEFRARGFPFAEVRLEHRALAARPERRGSELSGIIDYYVTKNLYRRLDAIRLVHDGSATFDDPTLRGLMKTSSYDFFGGSGAFDEQRVLADLVAIEAYHRERGFPAFRFLPPAARPGEVLFAYGEGDRVFALAKHPDSPNSTLVIRMAEGPRVVLGRVRMTGATIATEAELEALSGFAAGRPIGPLLLREGLEKLGRFYRMRGYHRLQLEPLCGTDTPSTCAAESLAGKDPVDLEVRITEGPLIRVGAIVWRGNAETDPHVLVRDLPQPGEVLDFDRINLAVRKMRALGTFNSVRVDVEGLDTPRTATATGGPTPRDEATEVSDVVLVVSVEETQYRFLDVALGLRSIRRANIGKVPAWAASGAGVLVDQVDRLTTGLGRGFPLDIPDLLLTFDFEYVDLNADGVGNRLRIPFNAGFSLSQFLRLATFDPSYTLPRLFDTDLRLTARGIAELDRVTDPLDRLELGVEGDLVIPLSDVMLAGLTTRAGVIQLQAPEDDCVYCLTGPPIGFGSSIGQETVDATADALACAADPTSAACQERGFRPQFTVGLRWRWDTQDTPLHPTRGFSLAASTSFILDRDRLASAPVFNQFVKWEASARAAISFQSIVFAAFFRYGGAATFGEAFLPPDERFTLGGSNGVRGFADNGICRYDKSGKLDPTCPAEFGGNVVINGSFELRVPVLESVGIWLGAFLDFGALAESHDQLYPESFRASSGFGIRWLLGGLFPIRLDVGFPLFSRRCQAYAEDGSCIAEEPSQVHFGLLYTF